jgi:hypothetical protein
MRLEEETAYRASAKATKRETKTVWESIVMFVVGIKIE